MASILFKWFFLPFCYLFTPVEQKSDVHPVYISVTEIEHNSKEHTLEISCKIFTNDLEETLSKTYNTRTDLFNPKDKAAVNSQIADYIKKHLGIKADGKILSIDMLGFEREDDAVWSYFEIKNVLTPPRTVEITNKILYETFPQQINLLHFTSGGKRKSTKLNNPETRAVFEF